VESRKKMKNLSTYIKNLNFEYAVSYSGLRGEKFKNLEKINKEKIRNLEKEIESSRFMQKPKLNMKIKELEDEINIYNSRIITGKNEFHQSTKQIRRFEKEEKDLEEIIEILNIEFIEQYAWMCPPIFRDAIVFYSKEREINGILQICFSCSSIKNENEETLEVDHKIFEKLKEKLIQIGHQIENE
jgi:hypothetical protein